MIAKASELLVRLAKRLRWLIASAVLVATCLAAFSAYTVAGSRTVTMYSAALGEERIYSVYHSAYRSRIIYVLDGHMDRNGWIAATLYAIGSTLRGHSPPTVVAIHSNQNRDIDFRNKTSTPTDWRPTLEGRAPALDAFLLDELLPQVEEGLQTAPKRTLSGFSLSGLYALDLATRSEGVFDRVQAFSPTFSHDTSISERLGNSCSDDTRLFANWGLESDRDTDVFQSAAARWQSSADCSKDSLTIRRHFGVIHALIMVTGHAENAFLID